MVLLSILIYMESEIMHVCLLVSLFSICMLIHV